jgi:hypothetical protein
MLAGLLRSLMMLMLKMLWTTKTSGMTRGAEEQAAAQWSV